MITIKHNSTTYTVTEANAAKVRAILDSGKFPKIKSPQSTPVRRDYPAFVPGMSTAEYVRQFNRQFEGAQVKVQHDCPRYHMPAPMIDATIPEVVEEIDPDWVQPVTQVKRKAPSAAQYRKACQDALDLLARGDIDTAQCVLSEVLK